MSRGTRQNEAFGGDEMNVNKLRAKMVEVGMNVDQLAAAMHKSRDYLYRRFKNPDDFTIRDVREMKVILGMTNAEACEIFLP